MSDEQGDPVPKTFGGMPPHEEPIICPVCGEVAVPEKCKIICRGEKCRGRVIMNCSEF